MQQSTETESRCTGHCCRRFVLSSGDETITHEQVKEWQDYGVEGIEDLDTRMIYGMVIPLDEADYFTCRNYNAETGDCMVYKDRPKMCRDYPSTTETGKCSYEECTLTVICNKEAKICQSL